jgi:hypothetical protein
MILFSSATLARLFGARRCRTRIASPFPQRSPLAVEALEDRTLPSASLIGFNSTSGDWKIATLQGENLQVSTAAHWDPYDLMAVVHGDFTGGGETDVAGWSNLGYWLVGVGSGNQFTTQQWLVGRGAGVRWQAFLVGDFTGDGKDDIAMFSPSGVWWVAVSTGSSFHMQRWSQPGDWRGGRWTAWEVGDFAGDGKADIAGLNKAGTWQVGVSTGSAFQPETWLSSATWAASARIQAIVPGDFNGDGKTDLAAYLANGDWLVAVSTGSTFTSAVWANYLFPSHSQMLFGAGDFNSDGLADVVALDRSGDAWVFTSSGSSFASPVQTQIRAGGHRIVRLNIGDFDGDGKDDLAVLTANGACYVAVSNGAGFAPSLGAKLGAGTWVRTFTSDQPETAASRHGVLRVSSPLYFITPQDLAELRRRPAYFATIFQAYQYRVRAELGAPFAGIDDQAVAFSLATIVAYEAAPYRSEDDPQGYFPPPSSYGVRGLLNTTKLVCNEYCYLAAELYRIAIPLAHDRGTKITMVGFTAGPFGNHCQLVFSSGGASLLGDPTVGLVVRTSFASLRSGRGVPTDAIRQLVYRVEVTGFVQNLVASLRNQVYGSLIEGLYPLASLAYDIPVTDIF